MESKSRTPFCSNTLTPRPRIQFGDLESNAFEAAQGSTQSAKQGIFSRRVSKSRQARNRGLSEVTPKSKGASPDRRSTLSSTPQHESAQGFSNRNAVQHGDSDVHARQPTRLQDATTQRTHPEKDAWKTSHPTKSMPDERRSGSDSRVKQKRRDSRVSFDSKNKAPVKKSSAVNQGHTADLCWFMRLQQAEGAVVPTEFSGCVVHPALVDRPETPTDLRLSALKSDSLGSLRSSRKHASISSKASTAGSSSKYASTSSRESEEYSSTWVESEASPPSSPPAEVSPVPISPYDQSAPSSPTAYEPYESTSPLTQSSMTLYSQEEEDPFLFIGQFIHHHTKNTQTACSPAKYSFLRSSPSPRCICSTTHSCHTYLHGRPSRHCCSCRLPLPQPEIQAAICRLEEAQKLLAEDPDCEDEMIKDGTFEALQGDMMLLEGYGVEMEKRCMEGIWWEGWKVVNDLRGEGGVASDGYGYEDEE